jgi:hypothetical protein
MRVQVGESSGGFFSSLECMGITGMAVVAEREGAQDAARSAYKHDPRGTFVPGLPGHAVLRTAMPELTKGLGVESPGQAVMTWQQLQRWGLHLLAYGAPGRIAVAAARGQAAAGLADGAAVGLRRLLARRAGAAAV